MEGRWRGLEVDLESPSKSQNKKVVSGGNGLYHLFSPMKSILALVAATASSVALISSAVPANAQSRMSDWMKPGSTFTGYSGQDYRVISPVKDIFREDRSGSSRGWGHSSGSFFGFD